MARETTVRLICDDCGSEINEAAEHHYQLVIKVVDEDESFNGVEADLCEPCTKKVCRDLSVLLMQRVPRLIEHSPAK